MPATMATSAWGLARAIRNGPTRAKPRANATFDVSVKKPFAATSWGRGTRYGIIDASAGPKKVVIVATSTISV